jgi:MbtH protein
MLDEAEDTLTYVVVMNHEEQYSIWPIDRPLPRGWTELSVRGPKRDCLAHIKDVWTDMRPLSLRRAMDGEAAPPARSVRGAAAPEAKTRHKAPKVLARAADRKRAPARATARKAAPKKTKRR